MAKINLDKGKPFTWRPGDPELDPVTFYLRGVGMTKRLELVELANSIGPDKAPGGEALRDMLDTVVGCVSAWDGVEIGEGEPAPCNEQHKRAFFDLHLDALIAVYAELMAGGAAAVMTEVRKNVLGAGSDTDSPGPDKAAEQPETTKDGNTDATGSPV